MVQEPPEMSIFLNIKFSHSRNKTHFDEIFHSISLWHDMASWNCFKVLQPIEDIKENTSRILSQAFQQWKSERNRTEFTSNPILFVE